MKGNRLTIAAMFALSFMVGVTSMFAGQIGGVVKAQFGASNAASQFGAAAMFLAYLFMGIPAGMVLKRAGYKFTSLLAIGVGAAGLVVQTLSGFVESFSVYVAGSFVSGLSMAMMFTVVNPLLNTLGGGGQGGNRLVQFSCSCNSFGGLLSPMILGFLFGNEIAKAKVIDALPIQLAALLAFVFAFAVIFRADITEPHLKRVEKVEGVESVEEVEGGMLSDFRRLFGFRHFVLGMVAVFLFEPIEAAVPAMMPIYFTQEGAPWYRGATYAGTIVSLYMLCMLGGRFLAGLVSSRVTTRTMMVFCSFGAIAMLLGAMYTPWTVAFVVATGLFTSVMFGGLLNLALDGLGDLAPLGSGVLMTLICGGALLALQGRIADHAGVLLSFWMTIGLIAVTLLYSLFGSANKTKGN